MDMNAAVKGRRKLLARISPKITEGKLISNMA
jgi:hypothetical protein